MKTKRYLVIGLIFAGLILLVGSLTGPFMYVDSIAPYVETCWSASECQAKLQECKTERSSYLSSHPNYQCEDCQIRCGVGMNYNSAANLGCTFMSGPGALAEGWFSCKMSYDNTPTKTVCVKGGTYWSNFMDGDYVGYDVYWTTENDKLLSQATKCSYGCRQVDERNAKCINAPEEQEDTDYEHRCLLIGGRYEVWQVSSLNRLIDRLDICTDNEVCKNGACILVSEVVAEPIYIGPNATDPSTETDTGLAFCQQGETADYAGDNGQVVNLPCVDGKFELDQSKCQVSTCLNYQVMGDNGQCVLSPAAIATGKGASDLWSQHSVTISIIAAAVMIIGGLYIYKR
jgi:hypothetical protein